jgi:hypothetical protein
VSETFRVPSQTSRSGTFESLVTYVIVGSFLFVEGRVTKVDKTRTFDWLNMATVDRIRSLKFPRFFGMYSCMGSIDLGGSGIVASFDGVDGA